ncbi:MAG TPA: hypothetical protein VK756_02360 [Solirubrobacteraceae bacterium]|nr:hypothetical protein [Solirubrobacteraceae bacterium]
MAARVHDEHRRRAVVAFGGMFTLACFYHWYTAGMYVAPVLAVGGWVWWSTKRIGKGQDRRQA